MFGFAQHDGMVILALDVERWALDVPALLGNES
jgi:hypothetical protein